MKTFGTREEYNKNGKNFFEKYNCPFCDTKSNQGHIIWEGKYLRNMLMSQGFPIKETL